MGLLDWLFPGRGYGVDELARRLDVEVARLRAMQPQYREFTIPKRSGGRRRILAPKPELKTLQRRILRRLLGRLKVHSAAMGFQRGRSIVTNARAHQGQAVVLRFDVQDFFPSTAANRVRQYFRRIGWNRPATELLMRLCTRENGLPQGAPTSPRLSNLVNYRLDARLSGMATALGGVYTRYADDITISFPDEQDGKIPHRECFQRNPRTGERTGATAPITLANKIHFMQRFLRQVIEEEGYRLHRRKKLSVRRRHQRQMVTGLVVNQRVNLPRELRRWLRAVEYRARSQRPASLSSYKPLEYRSRKSPTLSPAQLEGWRSLQSMIARQAAE